VTCLEIYVFFFSIFQFFFLNSLKDTCRWFIIYKFQSVKDILPLQELETKRAKAPIDLTGSPNFSLEIKTLQKAFSGRTSSSGKKKKKKKNVGVLSYITASDTGHGGDHLEIFRGTRRPPIRSLHRRIHLVLLSLHHHSRSCRHLDRNYTFILPIILRHFVLSLVISYFER
jgi:hypothetical protein